jgi:hypothetical protein
LKIGYDTEEFKRQFPQLMQELSEKKKSLKIEGVDYEIEQQNVESRENQNTKYCEDLHNPSVIDFIRRCTKVEDALKILDYLLERKELDFQDYNMLKNQINEEGGLEKLISDCGGLKTPGYYERKFPRKINILENDQSKTKNID